MKRFPVGLILAIWLSAIGRASAGMTVITGETGAGKSILLDSLGLTLGMRAEASLVRAGADRAQVIAEFDEPPRHPVYSLLKELEIEVDEENSEVTLTAKEPVKYFGFIKA